jgi:hypothetical protein
MVDARLQYLLLVVSMLSPEQGERTPNPAQRIQRQGQPVLSNVNGLIGFAHKKVKEARLGEIRAHGSSIVPAQGRRG